MHHLEQVMRLTGLTRRMRSTARARGRELDGNLPLRIRDRNTVTVGGFVEGGGRSSLRTKLHANSP